MAEAKPEFKSWGTSEVVGMQVINEDGGVTPTGFLDKYFPDGSIQYPNPTLTMLEVGLYHTYLSSTFLNGWINYVTPLGASLITRYRAHSKNLDVAAKFHDPENVDFRHHTRLSLLGDDVVILACSEPDEKHQFLELPPEKTYWLFWFDCDVSDCEIGRFRTTIPEPQLLEEFHEWAEQSSQGLSDEYSGNDNCQENRGGTPAIKLDVSRLNGWISF